MQNVSKLNTINAGGLEALHAPAKRKAADDEQHSKIENKYLKGEQLVFSHKITVLTVKIIGHGMIRQHYCNSLSR